MSSGLRWALGGGVLGAAAALVAFAPAAWLAAVVASNTHGQVVLADARGTVWNGSAQVVLGSGPALRTSTALPGRLSWSLGLQGRAVELQARLACCLNDQFRVRVEPGIGRVKLSLLPVQGAQGQWPAVWLSSLGSPWNTLRLGGMVRLNSPGLSVEGVQGRWAFSGQAELHLDDVSSAMASLPKLGSYTVSINGQAQAADSAALTLATVEGPLRLTGSGQWGGRSGSANLRFRGQASADPGSEAALDSLLNIIGRRQGAVSILLIG